LLSIGYSKTIRSYEETRRFDLGIDNIRLKKTASATFLKLFTSQFYKLELLI